MRLSMFNSNKEYAEYWMAEAEAVENNGLRIAKENLASAGKDSDLEWLRGQVEYLERKVKRYRNKAKKALAMGE